MAILESITIYRGYSYGNELNPLRGKVKFKHNNNALEIDLNEELSHAVLAVCAEQLVAASKLAAENMTADILEAKPSITNKSNKAELEHAESM